MAAALLLKLVPTAADRFVDWLEPRTRTTIRTIGQLSPDAFYPVNVKVENGAGRHGFKPCAQERVAGDMRDPEHVIAHLHGTFSVKVQCSPPGVAPGVRARTLSG